MTKMADGASTSRLRVILAASIGSALEWYDFFLYGTAAALVFGELFFPKSDPVVGTLLSFLTFGVGFVVRPFGGLLFGILGDRYGRKPVLVATLLMIGIGTTAIGFLPTYATVGHAAWIALVVLRLIQGLAVGGEYGGAVVYVAEHSRPNRRGLLTGWIQITSSIGLALSIAVIIGTQSLMSDADFKVWSDTFAKMMATPGYDKLRAERGLFMEQRQNRRDLACLLLADLSMSTDAHLDNEHRVIDVVTDSLLLFGEALSAVGDPFALYGFSSLRRQQVRMQELKSFRQPYGDETRGRIQALKPGYYTRMGAAIRQATELLGACKQRRKLLLLVTDGKPNDLDLYEGRYGVEDTRQAVMEARKQGLLPFCITIDREAGDYLPYMFGANGYTLIKEPQQLPFRLPQLYKQLTQP